MKYYAVTDDPNELMHYGILGMKWGVIRTPEQLGHRKPPKTTSINPKKVQSMLTEYRKGLNSKQISKPSYNAPKAQKNLKSPAYINASSKLRKMMKSGIDKAHASWENYNSPSNVAARQYKKNEKLFEKHVQLARQGRLKYKGISDAEVARITDRLDLERQARQLSGAEKPSFARRLISSAGEGIISGVGQGMAARTSERIGRGAKLKTQRKMQEQSAEFARKKAREDFKRKMKEQKKLDEYNDEHAEAKSRKENEEKYAKLATENRLMGYGNVYGDDNKLLRFDPSKAHKLSDRELDARLSMLEDAKKLYGVSEETFIKKNNGIVTKTKKNSDGSEEIVEEFDPNAYSSNRSSSDSARVTPHRSGNAGSSRVSANRRMFDDYADQEEREAKSEFKKQQKEARKIIKEREKQFRKADKNIKRNEKAEQKKQERLQKEELEQQRKEAERKRAVAAERAARIQAHKEQEANRIAEQKRAAQESADAAERERYRYNVRNLAGELHPLFSEDHERDRIRTNIHNLASESKPLFREREEVSGYGLMDTEREKQQAWSNVTERYRRKAVADQAREERAMRIRSGASVTTPSVVSSRMRDAENKRDYRDTLHRLANESQARPLFVDEERMRGYNYTPRPASYTVTRKPRRRTR